MTVTRNAHSTTQLCFLDISPPRAETDLAGNCISLQSRAMAILAAGLVAWEGFGFSPLLSSPHFLISHVCPPFPSLFPPHFLFVPFSHTHLFLRSFVITFPAFSLSPSSFIRCLPPFFHCLYFFVCLIPSLCCSASFCLFVSVFLCLPFCIFLFLPSFLLLYS